MMLVIERSGGSRVTPVWPRLRRPSDDLWRSRLVIDPVDVVVDSFRAGTSTRLDPDRTGYVGLAVRRFDCDVTCVGIISACKNYQAASNSDEFDSQASPVPCSAHTNRPPGARRFRRWPLDNTSPLGRRDKASPSAGYPDVDPALRTRVISVA
jgi:hypothetical protein